MSLTALSLLLLAAVNSCIGNLLIKKSRLVATADASFIAKLFEPYFIAGLAFYGINLLFFAKALDTAPVSIAYPVLAGMGFLFLALASTMLLGERLGVRELAGMVLIVAGVAFLAK